MNLANDITLIADGVEVPLPPDSQGIILLNIDSYGGGVPLWARGSKGSTRASRSSSLQRPYSMKRSKSLEYVMDRVRLFIAASSRSSRSSSVLPFNFLVPTGCVGNAQVRTRRKAIPQCLVE